MESENMIKVKVKNLRIGKYVHQGDVILTRVKKLPKNIKQIEEKTIAFGEVTGHSHRYADVSNVKMYVDDGGQRYIQLLQPGTLLHEEHAIQEQHPKGIYKIDIQRELDMLSEVRQVMD